MSERRCPAPEMVWANSMDLQGEHSGNGSDLNEEKKGAGWTECCSLQKEGIWIIRE